MINARILVRKGLKADFDPTKMLPGEWAVSIDASTSNQIVWMCFAPGVCKRMGTYEDFQNMVYNATGQIIERYEDAFGSILEEVNTNAETVSANTDIVLVAKSDIINTYLPQIKSYVSNASASASEAKTYSENAKASASEADKSAEDAKKYSQNAFSTTPEGYDVLVGDVDLLKNAIVQTSDRTLYGSKEGGIKLIGIGGASEQGENPSPDNPQEIESAGDLKNLLDLSKLVESTSAGITFTPNYTNGLLNNISAKGTLAGTAEYVLGKGIKIADWLKVGDYILSADESPQNDYIYIYFHIYSDEACKTSVKVNYLYATPITVSILEEYITNGYYIKYGIAAANGTEINNVFKPMLRKASVSNAEYKPYGYSLGIKASGKNLITTRGTSGAVNGITVTLNEDGSVTLTGTAGDGHSTIPRYNFVANFTGMVSLTGGYSQACHLYPWCATTNTRPYADESKTTLATGEQYDSKGEMLFYVEKGLIYGIRPRVYAGNTLENVVLYPMVRRADIADATYEPYRSKSITIPLNEPLRGIGDIRDEVVCQDGVWGVLKRIANVVVTESSYSHGEKDGYGRFEFSVDSERLMKQSSDNLICSHFLYEYSGYNVWNNVSDSIHECIAYKGLFTSRYQFGLVVYGITELADMNTWLAENPITVEYELATPTFEPFTDQTPFYGLESFDTVTHISTDSEVEPEITLEYGKSKVGAYTLENYNGMKTNEIKVSALEALTAELSAALVAGSEG